jgi:hypothetical protein
MFGADLLDLCMHFVTFLSRLFAVRALVATVAAAQPATAPVEEISQAAVQSAFQILSRDYIRREDLTFEHLNRVALEGLLHRLDFGAELVKLASDRVPPQRANVAEVVVPGVAYLRLRRWDAEGVASCRHWLKEWAATLALKHLILDLREPLPSGEFLPAGDLLQCFLPTGQLLFKLKQLGRGAARGKDELSVSSTEPLWKERLLVLLDEDANNQAETVAAVLQLQHRAMVLGGPSRGATVRYDTVPLDGNWALRFASAEMLLANDRSLFRKGLVPDLFIPFDLEVKRKQFNSDPLRELIKETPRLRFNEAALVHRQNPELTDFILRSKGEELPTDRAKPADPVLQRAVDLCLTTDHLAEQRMEWQSAAPPEKSEVKKGQPVD